MNENKVVGGPEKSQNIWIIINLQKNEKFKENRGGVRI
jgi:hypothetical protein